MYLLVQRHVKKVRECGRGLPTNAMSTYRDAGEYEETY